MDGLCRRFIAVKNSFSNNLDENGDYQFIMNQQILNGYCTGNNCSSNLEKINAGCLYLLDAFFKDSSVFNSVAKNNTNIVEYIMIWLSYMLSLKSQVGDKSNLQYFYDMYIQGSDKYKNSITYIEGYNNYKDLIDKTNMMNMDMRIISKFYDAFNKLCMMYIEFDEQSTNCKNCLKYADEFVKKYNELNNDSDIIKDSPYYKLLSRLSNDYDNFKKKYNDFPSLPTIETTNNSVQSYGQVFEQTGQSSEHAVQKNVQSSEDTSSSSSITNKLLLVLSIFGAISFFLGISYKYSLFGFRKRAQKQYLREKIKNIKRMNH
ncbi:BIR protein [Plasmodium berghei]|uniref:BIR protein n=1 Tax=Plasmodium berghei TaxID=5821 RepID=A0A1D3L6Z1_PLABE|nr:BIR protein [Plasmodium berghei]